MLAHRSVSGRLTLAAVAGLALAGVARADDVSPPAILQDFESTWGSISRKMPDVFAAGYGSVYTPPPGRAQSGDQSVGYDVYDRYDFGTAARPTLYGTGFGYKAMVSAVHQTGGNSYADLVWNHNGFADAGTDGFAAAGGYPGFALTLQTSSATSPGYNARGINAVDGDYHSPYASGDQDTRLAGLIDIDQASNHVFIRQPTVAGDPRNLPGPVPGATGWNGFALANVPKASNAQYYPDLSGPGQTYTSATVGGTFTRYDFNAKNPMAGTAVPENATGYLQRYAQYMVQVMGADGFRVDAAKNMPSWVMNYLDLATFNASTRTLLDGSKPQVFNYSEVFDSNTATLAAYVDKTGVSTKQSYVGGNRDVYDFPLFFAMQSNLSGNGYNNNWNNVVAASFDTADDGKMNGSQGVRFVQSQDNGAPSLDSVAYAYTLMLPGNAQVYFNGHNFGTASQRDFPKEGRGDALGGTYGTAVTTLVDLRNRFGRGNYRQDLLEKENLAFERTGSSLVLLSNRTDAGFDSRTVNVAFAPGTPLLEYTGNAHGTAADPNGDIPQLLVVNADSSSPTGASVNVRFLRNSTFKNGVSTYTGGGYLVYGLPTPTGKLSMTNVAGTFGNNAPASSDANVAYLNGTAVNSTVNVVKTGTFTLSLNTDVANLLGTYRDHPADGDNAILKVDGGVDVSGSGLCTDPSNAVTYGFGQFVTTHAPGYAANNGAGGTGTYAQTIDAAKLGQGYHYLTVEAFRHRDDGGPAVYTDWRQTIYVDLAPPDSKAAGFDATVAGTNESRTLTVNNTDGLADNVHVLLDVGSALTDAQVIAKLGADTQATQTDTATWTRDYANVTSGNHAATVVTYKPDGTYAVQRYAAAANPFLTVSSYLGLGLGDTDFNGSISGNDVSVFGTVLQSGNAQFNAAADVTGDGSVDLADAFLLGPILTARGANSDALAAYNSLTASAYVRTHAYTVNGTHVIYDDTAASTTVTPGSTLTAAWVRGGSLAVGAGATVRLASTNAAYPIGTSALTGLTLAGSAGAWTARLDLNRSALAVASTAATRSADLARLTSMAAQGFAGGAWTGPGLSSTAAAADATHLHAVGVILNDAGEGKPIRTTFGGQPVDAKAILAAYTLYGDANLDGVVDVADYTRIDAGFLLHRTGWLDGDFNYDGTVDASDYTLIDNAFNHQSSAAASTAFVARPTSGVATAVPEPTTALAVTFAAALLSCPRRRR